MPAMAGVGTPRRPMIENRVPATNGQVTLRPTTSGADEWRRLVDEVPNVGFVQTWEYGEAKAHATSWTIERHVVCEDDTPIGIVQAQVRRIPGIDRGIVWINRGPAFFDPKSPRYLSRMHDALKVLHQYWVLKRRYLLRIAPPVATTEKFVLDGLPFRNLEASRGWSSARLDLTPELDDLRKRLDSKWRNCLTKAERSGLSVSCRTDSAAVEEFCSDYAKFLRERRISTSVSPDLLRKLAGFSDPTRRPIVVSATFEDNNVGAAYFVRFGNCSEYMAALNTEKGRTLNVGNFLLWTAVRELKRSSCCTLDLGGMHPVETPKGIFHFKAGMGGTPYEHIGVLEAGAVGIINRIISMALR